MLIILNLLGLIGILNSQSLPNFSGDYPKSYDFQNPEVLNEWLVNVKNLEETVIKNPNSTNGLDLSNSRSNSFNLIDLFAPYFAKIKDEATCTASKAGFTTAHVLLQIPWIDRLFLSAAKSACTIAGLGSKMCSGIVDNLGPLYVKVVKDMDFKSPYAGQLASFAFIRACAHPKMAESSFRLPEPKPHALDKPGNRTTRILHLTDWHFDPLYKEGSEADCKRPTCCQEDSNEDESNPAVIKKPASKWGEYKCDIPRATLESMLGYIRQLHKSKPFDIVLFTGDIPAHDMWKESIEKSKYTAEITFNILKSYLNDLPGVKFYPVVGNHESVPVNTFPLDGQEEANDFFLYPFLANQWKSWLPESAFNSAKEKGYYSVKHNDNLKVIVLNNNLCYTYNPLLLLDPEVSDPNRMFTWLINELGDAEKSGSKVYIASHVPPASADCFQKFSVTWHKIVKAYSHLIVGQFYGHNHYDEFEIYYKEGIKSKDTAISNSFLAPSVTTHVNHNPGFRLYDVDPSNYLIRDYTQYYANLNDKLNWNNGPEWKALYNAKSAYPVPSSKGTYINGPFWHEVTELFETQKSYWDRFLFLKYKGSGLQPNCDENCRKNLICNLRASNSKQICSYNLDL